MSEKNEYMNFDGKVFKLLALTKYMPEGIEIGDKIAWSPVGPGELTDITNAGYPRVNYIAVACLISESGLCYGDIKNQILIDSIAKNKEAFFSYKLNDTYYEEGTGPYSNFNFSEIKIGDARDMHIEWLITYKDKADVLTESQKKQALRKQRCLEIADEQLQPLFKNFLVDIEKDKLAQQVKTLLASWIETAAEFDSNSNFYHGIVIQIGEMFGEAAKTSDDGSVQQDVLALKVPELVRDALQELKELKKASPL